MALQQERCKQVNVSEVVLKTGLCFLSLDLVEMLPVALAYLDFFKWRNSMVMLPPMPHHNRFMDRMKRDYDNMCRASLRFSGCSKNLSIKRPSNRLRPMAQNIYLPPDVKPITESEVNMAYLKYWKLQKKHVVTPLLAAPAALHHACLSIPI